MTNEATKMAETIQLGNRLLEEFGLKDQGWKFELTQYKVTLGTCSHSEKLIAFSLYYLHQPMEEIEETIRHEIAHALVDPKHGHDWVWKDMARRVGARPERCAPPEVKSSAKHNYEIECSSCGQRWKRYRLRRNLANYRSSCCSAKFNFYKRTEK
jgi:predicted SprT family Zn-dependent metalloprotease